MIILHSSGFGSQNGFQAQLIGYLDPPTTLDGGGDTGQNYSDVCKIMQGVILAYMVVGGHTN